MTISIFCPSLIGMMPAGSKLASVNMAPTVLVYASFANAMNDASTSPITW